MPPLPRRFLADIESEILAGLPNEQARRGTCLRSLDYYHLRGAKLIPRRDAEQDQDYKLRPKRSLPFARRVVNVLASKLYNPGPSRQLADAPGATAWLNAAYDACLVNSLWQQADRMAHLNGMCAIQVAASGDPARPLAMQLWSGWHEIVPLEAPGRANEVAACITIDCVDNTTRYTWWTDEFYRVYETDKLKPGQTSGGRVARFRPELSGDNPYGVLPFAFAWFERPTSGIDAVEGLGPFLSTLNATIDVEMSDMAQAVQAYHTPIPVAYDADVGWNPIVAMGKFLRVNSVPTDLERGPAPRLEYLQAELDIDGGWANIRGVIDSELEALGIPLTAYRMDSNTLPSGAALVAEQKPLADYAVERREPFRAYESDLARVSLTVGGIHYRKAELLAAARACRLVLTWPAQAIDAPSAERDQQDQASLELGLESRVMVVMRRFGLSREQALAHLEQVARDEAEAAEIAARLRPEPGPADDDDEDTEDPGPGASDAGDAARADEDAEDDERP